MIAARQLSKNSMSKHSNEPISTPAKIVKAGAREPRFLAFLKHRQSRSGDELPAKTSPLFEALAMVLLGSLGLAIALIVVAHLR